MSHDKTNGEYWIGSDVIASGTGIVYDITLARA